MAISKFDGLGWRVLSGFKSRKRVIFKYYLSRAVEVAATEAAEPCIESLRLK